MSNLKISVNTDSIENEIANKHFHINLSDHILHLKSFIPQDKCKQLIDELNQSASGAGVRHPNGIIKIINNSFS